MHELGIISTDRSQAQKTAHSQVHAHLYKSLLFKRPFLICHRWNASSSSRERELSKLNINKTHTAWWCVCTEIPLALQKHNTVVAQRAEPMGLPRCCTQSQKNSKRVKCWGVLKNRNLTSRLAEKGMQHQRAVFCNWEWAEMANRGHHSHALW